MRPVLIPLLLTVAPALTACDDLKASGGLRVPPPDAEVVAACDAPEAHLRSGDWEIIAGRLGVALIRCGQGKAALVEYMNDLRGAVE